MLKVIVIMFKYPTLFQYPPVGGVVIDVSDDDETEEDKEGPWFNMGITREEKLPSRRFWRKSVIIKLVGRKIGNHYLLKRIHAMWRVKSSLTLINLPNDFYIARLSSQEDYAMALFNGPWMIGDHYLYVQRWRPNFSADIAHIDRLPVWVRFPILLVEYYTTSLLYRVGNKIRKTLKVDLAMLTASRGKFARVCMDVDLNRPLKAGYMLKRRMRKVQYEGLHTLCFKCGRYGHDGNECPEMFKDGDKHNQPQNHHDSKTVEKNDNAVDAQPKGGLTCSEWMVAKWVPRRSEKHRKSRRPRRQHNRASTSAVMIRANPSLMKKS